MQNRRVAVRGIILKGNKLLCVRHKKYFGQLTEETQDYWCTPGGGVETGEALIPALERELIEETGIKPIVGELLYIQQFERKEGEHLEFFFNITNPEDFENIDLENSSHGSKEIAEIDFIDPATSNILPEFLKKQNLTEDLIKGTTKVFNYLPE